ncbi:zinc transporter ZIP12 [Strongylocentrotus purpuratus]|uniref:Zinc transporter ZIP12 n=1 Tax=Strongylocentrotus purpuratus TaxID=7668 RepID=A0A7M7PBE1_STRPU|nr:zinc transporter ZIP12 [Strongylocentrotus purpuratus]
MASSTRFSVVGILSLLFLQSLLLSSSEEVLRRHRRQDHDHDHDHDGDLEEEYFAVVGNFLLDQEITAQRVLGDFEENHDQNFTSTQVAILVSTLFSRVGCENRVNNCSKCSDDFVTDLFTALNVDPAYGFSEDVFHEATPLLLYATFDLEAVCAAGAGGTDLGEETVFGELMSAGADGTNATLSEEDLEEILHTMSENYTATTQTTCFDVESVFTATVGDHEAGASEAEVHAIAELVVSNLLKGYCIGEATLPSPDDFVDAVFNSYATGGVIPEEELEHLLSELGIGGSSDEHDDHGDDADDDGDDHDDHDHRRRRHAEDTVPAVGYRHRVERAADEHDHGSHNDALNVSATCYTGEQLLDIHGVDHEAGMSEAQYTSMLPSLIQQILSGACSGQDDHEDPTNSYTDAEIWGYSNLAVLIISLLAVLGAAFIPCMSGFVYEAVLQTMMALAVATLTGDAVLHLIPQAVGLHAHDSSGHDHTVHGPANPELAYVWKCLAVEMAIYAFFLVERVSSLTSCCKHSHAHGNRSINMQVSQTPIKGLQKTSKVSDSERNLTDAEDGDEKQSYCLKGCGTVPLMIVMGDALHNFGDGLAIGAAFTIGIPAGLSTTIAVFCHELPHELGDLAVLLNQGMRLSTAVFWNLLSACTCFVGLWVGIPLAQTQNAREWIFAATAGTFLYVGLVHMLPLLHAYKGERKGIIFCLQNFGFLLGILVILVIALYEDAISIAL